MIKENELRVDNWLTGCNGKYFQIDAYGILDVHNQESVRECLSGIPLSESILLKAGGVQVHFLIEGCFYFGGNEFIVGTRQINAGFTFSVKQDSSIDYCQITNRLEFLHQLQNLYYCLVGEELVIDL